MGLIATAFSTALILAGGELRDRLTFLHATDIELRTIEDQFRTYTALLRGGAGLFAANDDTVTLAQFRAYVQRIEFQTLYPGVLGFGFTPAIRPRARAFRRQGGGLGAYRVSACARRATTRCSARSCSPSRRTPATRRRSATT